MICIRDAHGIIIERFNSKVEALECAAGTLDVLGRQVLTIECDGDVYIGRLVGEITQEVKEMVDKK